MHWTFGRSKMIEVLSHWLRFIRKYSTCVARSLLKIYSGFLAASRWRMASRSFWSMIDKFWAATQAWRSETPAFATATGNESPVNTLNMEMPKTAKKIQKKLYRIYIQICLCAKCRYLLNMMLTCGSISEMQQIQSRIEHFITEAHEGQNILLVIESHNKILTWIKEFVRCFSLHRGTEKKNQPFS